MDIKKIPRLVFWINFAGITLSILIMNKIDSSVLATFIFFLLYVPILNLLFFFNLSMYNEFEFWLLMLTLPLNSLIWAWIAKKILDFKISTFKKVFLTSFSYVMLVSVTIFICWKFSYRASIGIIVIQYILYSPSIFVITPFSDGLYFIHNNHLAFLIVILLNSLTWALIAKHIFCKDIKAQKTDNNK